MKQAAALLAAALALAGAGCRGRTDEGPARPYKLAGPLIPATATMVAAWDVPRNPYNDTLMAGSRETAQIRRGYLLFTETPQQAARYTHDALACSNCHLNSGQRQRALPLVGIATAFPEFNKRAARLFSLEDRIVDCFLRSENAAGGADLPTASSPEVLDIAAYLTWLSQGYALGKPLPWRGQNAIAPGKLIPVAKLDPGRGGELFADRCVSCHGADGQGVQIGDKKAGPLWGPASWNDGAGAARVYTLAGIIRYSMPYLDPGSLTDEEAQQIARFITSKPRPTYPFKTQDYPGGSTPPDAVYYRPTPSLH